MTSWENKKNLAETTLKKRYNGLHKRCLAMDDGTAEIVNNPVFKKLNDELRDVARSIASLEGIDGDLSEVMDFFKAGELYKGFEVENAA